MAKPGKVLSVLARIPAPGSAGGSGPAPGAPDDEADLLARTGRGEAVAFRALATRHLSATLAIARRMLRDDAEAEDVTQEAMLRLWRNAAELDVAGGGVKPWLRRVVSNLCIDRIRSARHVDVVEEVPEQPQAADQLDALENRDMALRVDGALKALPDRQRLALVMFHYEGLSQIEVGKVLGVSDEAVESLLSRARRALKVALKDDWRELLSNSGGS